MSIVIIWFLAFVGGMPQLLRMKPFARDRTAPVLSAKWAHCSLEIAKYFDFEMFSNFFLFILVN